MWQWIWMQISSLTLHFSKMVHALWISIYLLCSPAFIPSRVMWVLCKRRGPPWTGPKSNSGPYRDNPDKNHEHLGTILRYRLYYMHVCGLWEKTRVRGEKHFHLIKWWLVVQITPKIEKFASLRQCQHLLKICSQLFE